MAFQRRRKAAQQLPLQAENKVVLSQDPGSPLSGSAFETGETTGKVFKFFGPQFPLLYNLHTFKLPLVAGEQNKGQKKQGVAGRRVELQVTGYLGGCWCPAPPVEFKLMRTLRFLHQEREPAPLKACRRETYFLPGHSWPLSYL